MDQTIFLGASDIENNMYQKEEEASTDCDLGENTKHIHIY